MSISKDIRRDQVISAALKLIGEYGMGGLTTASIAKEVGISEANIYRHFQNKQEVLFETVRRVGEGLKRNVKMAIDSSPGSVERLKRIFQLHIEYLGQNRGIPRLLFSDNVHMNESEIKPRLLQIVANYVISLEKIIREGMENGSIRPSLDPKATALTLIGMAQVCVIRWILSDFMLPVEDEAQVLWNNFEGCIKQSP